MAHYIFVVYDALQQSKGHVCMYVCICVNVCMCEGMYLEFLLNAFTESCGKVKRRVRADNLCICMYVCIRVCF